MSSYKKCCLLWSSKSQLSSFWKEENVKLISNRRGTIFKIKSLYLLVVAVRSCVGRSRFSLYESNGVLIRHCHDNYSIIYILNFTPASWEEICYFIFSSQTLKYSLIFSIVMSDTILCMVSQNVEYFLTVRRQFSFFAKGLLFFLIEYRNIENDHWKKTQNLHPTTLVLTQCRSDKLYK